MTVGMAGQGAPAPQAPPRPAAERLGPNLFRIGNVRVDTAKREVSAPGTTNDVKMLEWVANTKGGNKAYESAITLETDAVSFNAALLLIGLDKSRARVPEAHFDQKAPEGDRVEITVEFERKGERVRLPVEQILYDLQTKQSMPSDGWVYTGSSFLFDGRFWAEADGTLIGFVHSPAPLIEQVGRGAVNRFGAIVLNTEIGIAPNMPVTLTVRSLAPAPPAR
jgi:hypothetical protein